MNRFLNCLLPVSLALLFVGSPRSAAAQAACYTAWSSTAVYTAGQTASYNNVNYTANWWTQGQNPSTNNGGSGSGQPWTSDGACSNAACTTTPGAPAGLAASQTTSTGTTLSWTAVSAPANCTITSYTVLENGNPVGTTTGTSFSVTGLTASTTYSFTVEATDAAGTSTASTPALDVTTSSTSTQSMIVAGWFEEWSIYYASFNIANLQQNGVADSLTHLIYAFGDPVAPTSATAACQLADPWADYQDTALPQVTGPYSGAGGVYGNFGAIQQLKAAHPNLKTLISIGGYSATNAWTNAFVLAASTPAGRTALASSCINMFISGNLAPGITAPGLFDGINIDWEFPTATDTANFTALLTEFRKQLNALSATTGKTYLLSFDAAAGKSDANNPGGYDTIDIPGTVAQVDFITVDGYNYAGDWSFATNDASPLYDEPANPLYNTGFTIDDTVEYYLATGIPPSKYTVGFPLYGAGWTGGLTSANSGMYQTATGYSPVPNLNGVGNCSTGDNQSSPAAGCDYLLTNGLATYRSLINLLNNGYTASYDSTRAAARMYSAAADTAFSYDNAQSIAAKVAYIKAKGLGGGYVWALKDDDANGTLTKALAVGLNP